jgi:hypothetical protein
MANLNKGHRALSVKKRRSVKVVYLIISSLITNIVIYPSDEIYVLVCVVCVCRTSHRFFFLLLPIIIYFLFIYSFLICEISMDQERAMMIYLSYQKLRMPTFSVRQRRTENPLRERLLVRKFIAQLET